MSKYVKKEDVLRIIDSYTCTEKIAEDINQLPFVEKEKLKPQRSDDLETKCFAELSEQSGWKKGQLVPQKGDGYCCSECGNYVLAKIEGNFIHVTAKTDYCPYCGSYMKGEK